MTAPDQRNYRFPGLGSQNKFRSSSRHRSLRAVPEAVNNRKENAAGKGLDHITIPRLRLPVERKSGHSPIERHLAQGFHFFATTVVPFPRSEAISNSSISRRTPGRPRPKLP